MADAFITRRGGLSAGSNAAYDDTINGSTAEPVSDVQKWLNCANIYDKNYTVLSDVLNDNETLFILMSNNNAVNYLVRSTSWANDICNDETAMICIGGNGHCSDVLLSDNTWLDAICNSNYFEYILNVKVPIMTGESTPSGVASASSTYSTYYAWRAFRGIGSTTDYGWVTTTLNNQWIQYKFEQASKIYMLKISNVAHTGYLTQGVKDFKVQVSSDGIVFSDVYSGTAIKATVDGEDTNQRFAIGDNGTYNYWRISLLNNHGSSTGIGITDIQFYGRKPSTSGDDIQTWLHYANIYDKNYTTLSAVLNDPETLHTLIFNNNAVDYMARSTDWATNVCADYTAMTYIGRNNYCADKLLSNSIWRSSIANSTYFERVLNAKIPIMESNTAPKGVVSAVSEQDTSHRAFHAVNGGSSSFWANSAAAMPQWWKYDFGSAGSIKPVLFKFNPLSASQSVTITYQLRGSSDDSTYTELFTSDRTAVTSSAVKYNGENSVNVKTIVDIYGTAYRYVQYYQKTTTYGNYANAGSLQVYGRRDVAISTDFGIIPMVSKEEWTALTISQKREFGLTAIEYTENGYDRGELVYGANYPEFTFVESGTAGNSVSVTLNHTGSYKLFVFAINTEASQYQLNTTTKHNDYTLPPVNETYHAYYSSGTDRRNYRVSEYDITCVKGDSLSITLDSYVASYTSIAWIIVDTEYTALNKVLSSCDATTTGTNTENGMAVYGYVRYNQGGTITAAQYSSGDTITATTPGGNYVATFIYWFT